MTLSGPGAGSQRMYLGESDWKSLGRGPRMSRTTAGDLLLRSRHLLEVEQDLRLATVEAVSAAETVIAEVLRGGAPEAKAALLTSENFAAESITHRLRVVASLYGIREALIAESLDAFDFRNRIVHDGWEPQAGHGDELVSSIQALLEVACRLLGGTECRTVSATPGASIQDPAAWERAYIDEPAARPPSARRDIRL